MLRLGVAAMALFPATAWAQTQVTFDLDEAAVESIGLDAATVEGEMSALIADQLNLGDPQAFVDGMAQAAAISSKGMGTDYATNFEQFVFGGSLGSAVAGSGAGFGRGDDLLPEGGFAFQASLMAGINLGLLTPGSEKGVADRFRLYVSGMGFAPPGGRQFRGSMWNLAGYAQVKVIGPADAKVVEWGGLDLTTGFSHSTYTLSLASPELPFGQDVGPAEVTWLATGTYDVSASAQTVPIEVSTNLRVVVASVFVGGAYDLNLDQAASSEIGLAGPIEAAVDGRTEPLGTATVTNGASASGVEYVPRVFFGAQANLTVIKIYGQINVGLNNAFGGHLGLRIAK